MHTKEPDAHEWVTGLAATVVLLRTAGSGTPGVELLLLERPHDRGSFAGAFVFPGGAVDPGDLDSGDDLLGLSPAREEAATRNAAVRETLEETGLQLQPDALVTLSRWHPPREAPKRLRTWFFLAEAPRGAIVLEPNEAVGSRWLSPERALELHASDELRLFPPTWLTVHGLLGVTSVAEALHRGRGSERGEFETRMAPGGRMVLWAPDAAYGDGAVDPALLDAPGPRNRLEMRELPWRYLRTEA